MPRSVAEVPPAAMQAPSMQRYPIVADPADGTLWLEPSEEEHLAIGGRAWALRLRYDATLVSGRDLTEGLAIPPPDRPWAQLMLLSPWALARFAAGATQKNRTDFRLPDEPGPRLRSLAKLAIYGGAALLMGRGEFRSYRGSDVLPTLAASLPEWASFLEETGGLYLRPIDTAAERIDAYLAGLVRWLDWIGGELWEGEEPTPCC
jgi:hypothetical protein